MNFLKKDYAFNPEEYGIHPLKFWVMQRNMQNTPQPMLVAQDLSMKPQWNEEMSQSEQSEYIEKKTINIRKTPHNFRPISQSSLNIGMPSQTEGRLDHPINLSQSEAIVGNEIYPSQYICSGPEDITEGTQELRIDSNVMSRMQENNEQTTQLSFVKSTFELVKQRYENISPPTFESQSEMCINSRNKMPPAEAAVNSPSAPPGYISGGPISIGMIQQNYEQTSFAQNLSMKRNEEMSQSEQSEYVVKDTKNIRKKPHNFRPIPQPSFKIGMPLPYYSQANRHSEHAKKMSFVEFVRGNDIPKPSEDYKEKRENNEIMLYNVQRKPENLASQDFGLRQQNYEETPISLVQTERSSGTPRDMLNAQADLGKANALYKHIERFNQHTDQPILMPQIFYQQRHGNDQLAMPCPQTEERLDHSINFSQSEAIVGNEIDASQYICSDLEHIDKGTDEMQIDSNAMSRMQENNDQTTQLSFVKSTFELVKQRYENISPPTFESQSELCINSRNKVSPAKAAVNSPSAPPGYISGGPISIGMIRQNYEQTSSAQNFEMDRQWYEVFTEPSTSGNAQYLPSQNMGMVTYNTGIEQHSIRETPQPKFVDAKFDMHRRSYEHLPRSILFPQTEIRTQPTTRMLYPEAVAVTGNPQYVPFDNIVKTDFMKMHQNRTQSQETVTQTFEMDQRICEGMAQSSPHAQPPTYFAPHLYNACARQRSRRFRHPPFFYKNPGKLLQPHQPQQTHPYIANTHHYVQKHPKYAPQYRLYNQKQMQRQTYNYGNQFYNQHDFHYDAARCNNRQQHQQQQLQHQQQLLQQQQQQQHRQQQQRQLHQQQQQQQQLKQHQQQQQQQQQRKQHQQKQHQQQQEQQQQYLFLQQIAMQQSYILNQSHGQTAQIQRNNQIQQRQQELLHRIDIDQRSHEYCQYYEQQNNTKR